MESANTKFTIDLKAEDKLYQNTNQEWIVTTKDKLKIVLMESEKSIGEKKIMDSPSWLVYFYFNCFSFSKFPGMGVCG